MVVRLRYPRNIPFLSFLAPAEEELPYPHRPRRRPTLSLPPPRAVPYIVFVFVVVCWLVTRHRPLSGAYHSVAWSMPFMPTKPYPLSFSQIYDYQRRLPQHNPSLPPPEGKNGRYILFHNEVWSLGLNNQLNNRIILSHLAYMSNRSYVFRDVTFSDDWEEAVWFPLNTFISGPTAGGAFPPHLGRVPRAVNEDYYNKVCRKSRELPVENVTEELGLADEQDGAVILDRWAEKLRTMSDNCIKIPPYSRHIIDHNFLGSENSLSLFPVLSGSPIITAFRWSDVVLNTVSRSIPFINHSNAASASPVSHFSPPGTTRFVEGSHIPASPPEASLSHVLAIHVRRGDYDAHCEQMFSYGSMYNSWNRLPTLPDKYAHTNDHDEFMRHCFPSVDDIVDRVRAIKNEHAGLRVLYILTNGKVDWLKGLKDALINSDMGWERVTSSRDLTYVGVAEKVASQAADMEIARRSGVFIGNGFSTMTANIVLFRVVSGISAQTVRFW